MAMPMSDTMSASNDWFQFYQQQQQNFPGAPSSSISDATAVTTVVSTTGAAATSPPLAMLNSSTSSASTPSHLSPEGRVAKPVRRRSRASRRTPTTLLNTDTSNFRAMVQQFTGGPSAPFAPSASSSSSGFGGLGFGFGPPQAHVSPGGLMVAPLGYHLQQQQQMFQQQSHQYAFNGSDSTEAGNNRFFQRLNDNPRPPSDVTDHGVGGFVTDHGGGLGRFFPSAS